MSTITFGQLESWDAEGGSKHATKDDFAQTRTDGKYVYRFIDDPPFKYSAHWVEMPNGKKIKVNCAIKDCVLCGQKVERQTNYVSTVLNRDVGRCQLFEFRKQVFDGLKLLHGNKKHWGALINYDVEIDRKLARKPEVYRITPLPKEPLTAEELAMIEEFKARVDINKHTAAMTNDEIEAKIARASENTGFGGNNNNSGGGSGGGGFGGGNHTYTPKSMVSAPVQTAAASVEEDPDFSFN